MSAARIVALLASALGLGGAVWIATRPVEGEPVPPIALPELPADKGGDPGAGAGSGPSGIPSTADEIEALARTIASEAGSGTAAEQAAIAWTVRNRFRGKSIYATQYPWRSQKGADPPFSSAREAKESHRQLARQVLAADQSQDPTGGATSFFEPKMQDVFAKAGALARAGETGDRVIDGVKLTDITRFKAYKKDADGIRSSWAPGSALYARAGRFEFWGSARLLARRGSPAPREVSVGQALELLDAEVLG